MNQKHALAAAIAALASLAAAPAQAQVAGTMTLQLGWNRITPHVRSGELSAPSAPDTRIDVDPASSLLVAATYMWTDAWATEFLAGADYRHDIIGVVQGQRVGKIGSVHQISPTLLLQYRFLNAEAAVRPYVGAGPTYAIFFGTEGSAALTAMTNPGGSTPTTIGSDRSLGATVQLGASARVGRHWFVDGSVLKTWISSTTPLSTGQRIDARLDPVSVNVSVGYRF